MQLVGVARRGPDLRGDLCDRCRIERAKPARVGGRERAPDRDGPRAPLLERRVVEVGPGAGVEELVRDRRGLGVSTATSRTRRRRSARAPSGARPSPSPRTGSRGGSRDERMVGTGIGPTAALSWQATCAGNTAASRSSERIRAIGGGIRFPLNRRGMASARVAFQRQRTPNIGAWSAAWTSTSSRRRSRRRCSACAGAGTRRARSPSPACSRASACPRYCPDARRGPARRGVPGAGRLPGRRRRRAECRAQSPARRTRRSVTACARRWTRGAPLGARADRRRRRPARGGRYRRSPRRSRTSSSTPAPGRTSTTRRSRSVARGRRVRRALPPADASGLGRYPGGDREVAAQVWPAPRDADEVHDALLDLVVLPAARGGGMGAVARGARGGGAGDRMTVGECPWWVAAERVGTARAAADGSARGEPVEPRAVATFSLRSPLFLRERNPEIPSSPSSAAWRLRLGPTTAAGSPLRVGLAPDAAAGALAQARERRARPARHLPAGRAPYSPDAPHWCERSVLARIHRLTLGRLRREIEPTAPPPSLRFLARWRHVARDAPPRSRAASPRSWVTPGFHAAAGAWERDLLPAPGRGLRAGLLDALCTSGDVAWGPLHVAPPQDGGPPRRKGAPRTAPPVTIALRERPPVAPRRHRA